jgi:type II secretory ATPase GspE/PulE/Tfp pilus assembly ATPase PilB-like protein
MTMNDECSELVVRRATIVDLKEAATRNGYREMREDGLDKILMGATTPKEVARVVFTAGH